MKFDFPKKAWTFLKEAKIELYKVKWPTRQDTINYTLIVVGLSLIIAIFLGGLDVLFANLLSKYVF